MSDSPSDQPPRGPVNHPPKKARLQPISRITSGAFSQLRNLKCFVEVDRRIRLGWSSLDTAGAIQEEYGEMEHLSVKYVAKMLDRYRKTIPVAELSMVAPNSQLGHKVNRAMDRGIDELEELERLYRMQMQRIEIDVLNEQKISKLLPTTGNEIFVAAKIIKQVSDLKMDLGLAKRQLGTIEVTGQLAAEATTRYGKESVGRVIADPDSRRKVLNFAERLLELTGKAGLDSVTALIDQQSAAQDVIDADCIEVPVVDLEPQDDATDKDEA